MPRYYIDTTDGEFCAEDEEGSELPDLIAARQAAMAVLPEIAQQGRGLFGTDIASIVRDANGAVLFKAKLTVSEEWLVTPPV